MTIDTSASAAKPGNLRRRHAVGLGVVGLVPSVAGAIVTIPMDIGPAWYPISLVLTSVPCAWLGGLLHSRSSA